MFYFHVHKGNLKLPGAFTDEFKKIFVIKHGTSNSRVKFVFLAEEWGQGYLIEKKIIFWRSHEISHIKWLRSFRDVANGP